MFFSYIWNNKRDKVSRKQMIKDYGDGGCRMIDIYSYIKALKLTVLRRLITSDCDWAPLFSEICSCDVEKLVKFGDEYPLICSNKTSNNYWKEALLILHEYISIIEKKCTEPHSKSVLYNSSLCINNKTICFKILYEKCIIIVSDLLDENGNTLSFNDLKEKI